MSDDTRVKTTITFKPLAGASAGRDQIDLSMKLKERNSLIRDFAAPRQHGSYEVTLENGTETLIALRFADVWYIT